MWPVRTAALLSPSDAASWPASWISASTSVSNAAISPSMAAIVSETPSTLTPKTFISRSHCRLVPVGHTTLHLMHTTPDTISHGIAILARCHDIHADHARCVVQLCRSVQLICQHISKLKDNLLTISATPTVNRSGEVKR